MSHLLVARAAIVTRKGVFPHSPPGDTRTAPSNEPFPVELVEGGRSIWNCGFGRDSVRPRSEDKIK